MRFDLKGGLGMPAQKSDIISKRSDYPFLARLTLLRAKVSNKNLRKLQATKKSLQKMFGILFFFGFDFSKTD